MTREISNMDDLIDLRDVIARFETLEDEIQAAEENPDSPDTSLEQLEIKQLEDFLGECKGNGGDEQWRGDWYPVTAIRDSYFKNYAQELAEDLGSIKSDLAWPYNCIDWDKAARELQYDYTSVEFDGVTYWVR